MNAGVDLNEHPDRRRHVAHTSPHRQHSTGVVVLLESRATLSLDQNDYSVENLVELGEVEPPAPESKALIPHPADISAVWEAVWSNVDVRVPAAPRVRFRVVCNCVTKTSGSLDLAKRIDGANEGIGLPPIGEGSLQAVEHGHAGEGGVDGEEDIVGNDEGLEPAVAGNPPRLVAMLAIVPVEVGDGDGVHSRNCQRNFGVKRLLKDILRDLERVRKSRFAAVGVRDRRWCSIWGKLQDRP